MAVRRLSPEEAGRLLAKYVVSDWLVVGVGSELRCDDGFGPYLARIVRAVAGLLSIKASIVDAGNAPELYTDVMREHGRVLLLDAVEVSRNYGPGTLLVAEIEGDENNNSLIVSTHSINLPVIMRVSSLSKVVVLGVVPGCLSYRIGLSREVASSLRGVVFAFLESVRELMYKYPK